MSNIDESQRPVVFQRVIEFDMEQGNTAEAKAMVEKAADFRVSPLFERADAKTLFAQVQRDRDAKKMAAASNKEESDFDWEKPEKSTPGSKTGGEKSDATSSYDAGFKEGIAMGEYDAKIRPLVAAEKAARVKLEGLQVAYRDVKELADKGGNLPNMLEALKMKGRIDGYRKAIQAAGINVR